MGRQLGNSESASRVPTFSKSVLGEKGRERAVSAGVSRRLRSVRTWPKTVETPCQGLAPERLLCSQPVRTSDRALSAPFSAVLISRSPFPTVGSSPESYAQSPWPVGFQIFTRSDHTDMELVILWEGQQLTEPQELPASSRDWLVGGKAM